MTVITIECTTIQFFLRLKSSLSKVRMVRWSGWSEGHHYRRTGPSKKTILHRSSFIRKNNFEKYFFRKMRKICKKLKNPKELLSGKLLKKTPKVQGPGIRVLIFQFEFFCIELVVFLKNSEDLKRTRLEFEIEHHEQHSLLFL